GKKGEFKQSKVSKSLYRPFSKAWLYYDPQFNHRFKEKLYPSASYSNMAIIVPGTGSTKDFNCLIVNTIPDLNIQSGGGQCFPLYWYEKATDTNPQGDFGFDGQEAGTPDANGYIKRDGITDVALANFRQHYNDESITKEDIFYYVYGVLHSPEY